jgi:hypothetical protein
MAKVKSGSIYYNNRRIAVMQGLDYTLTTNDGLEIADGVTFNTDGIATGKVSCTAVVPVRGVGVSVLEDALRHRDITLTLGIIDGKLHEIKEARAEELNYSGETASGKLTGKFSWHFGGDKLKISSAPGV